MTDTHSSVAPADGTSHVTGSASTAPKESLIARMEAELAIIPDDIAAEVKKIWADLKAHL